MERSRTKQQKEIMMENIYKKAKRNGLINKKRWEEGICHHSESEKLMNFLIEHDFNDYGDYFCWKKGGDGDNGETLMYEMDVYFEQKDLDKKENRNEL